MSKQMTFPHFGILDYMVWGMLDNGEKFSGIDQYILIRFGIFGSIQIFIYSLVSCFHFSDVKEYINWLIFKCQRNLRARENAFKNNLLAVPAD